MRIAPLICSVALLLLVGCGDDAPDLGTVTGKVTRDGKPVADAYIQFMPAAEGAISSGHSDKDGNYTLKYGPGGEYSGALPGEHSVKVELGSGPLIPADAPEAQEETEVAAARGSADAEEILLEDKFTVSEGENTINLELPPKGGK